MTDGTSGGGVGGTEGSGGLGRARPGRWRLTVAEQAALGLVGLSPLAEPGIGEVPEAARREAAGALLGRGLAVPDGPSIAPTEGLRLALELRRVASTVLACQSDGGPDLVVFATPPSIEAELDAVVVQAPDGPDARLLTLTPRAVAVGQVWQAVLTAPASLLSVARQRSATAPPVVGEIAVAQTPDGWSWGDTPAARQLTAPEQVFALVAALLDWDPAPTQPRPGL